MVSNELTSSYTENLDFLLISLEHTPDWTNTLGAMLLSTIKNILPFSDLNFTKLVTIVKNIVDKKLLVTRAIALRNGEGFIIQLQDKETDRKLIFKCIWNGTTGLYEDPSFLSDVLKAESGFYRTPSSLEKIRKQIMEMIKTNALPSVMQLVKVSSLSQPSLSTLEAVIHAISNKDYLVSGTKILPDEEGFIVELQESKTEMEFIFSCFLFREINLYEKKVL
jgi:hypothetical protein